MALCEGFLSYNFAAHKVDQEKSKVDLGCNL